MTQASTSAQSSALRTALGWISRGQLGPASQRAYVESPLRQLLERTERAERREREGVKGAMEEAIGHIERLAAMCPEGLAKDAAVEWVAERKRGGAA